MTLTPQERLDLLRSYGQKQEEEERAKNSFGIPRLAINEAPSQSVVDDYACNVLLVAQPYYRSDEATLPYIPYNRYSLACNGKPHYIFNAPQSFQFPDGADCEDPIRHKLLLATARGDQAVLDSIKEQARHLWFAINLDKLTDGVCEVNLPAASGNALYQLWLTYMRRENVDLTSQAASKIVGIGAYKAANGFRQYTFTAFRSGSMQELARDFMPKGMEILVSDLIAKFYARPLCDLLYVYGPKTLTDAVEKGATDKDAARAERDRLAAAHGGHPIPTSCLTTVTGEPLNITPEAPPAAAPEEGEDELPFDQLDATPAKIGMTRQPGLNERIQLLDGDAYVDVTVTERRSDGTLTCLNDAEDVAYELNPETDSWRWPPKPPTPPQQDVAAQAIRRATRGVAK